MFFGMHFFWWLFWIALIAAFTGWVATVATRRTSGKSPLYILKRRFAAGKLSKEEYEERIAVLEHRAIKPSSELPLVGKIVPALRYIEGENPGVYRTSEGHGGGYTDYRRRSHGGGYIGGDGMTGITDYDYDRES